MEVLDSLVTSDIVVGREKLVNNSWNLSEIATKSEEAFKQARSKEGEKAVIEQTKTCVTHALASVAHQINTLASDLNALIEGESNEMKMLHYEVNQLEMKGRVFDSKRDMKRLSKFISRKFTGENKRKTKRHLRARHSKNDRYISTEIDYGALDKIGHGMVFTPQKPFDLLPMQQQPPSPVANVKKESSRWSIPEPVWKTPMKVTASLPGAAAATYDFKIANTSSHFPSSLGVGDSIYTDALPASRASSVSSLSSSPSSLRLRRESDDSVAQTPTTRNVSNYFMFLNSNDGEYASFDDYQLGQSKGNENATLLPARPIKHSDDPVVDMYNEPVYADVPFEPDIESVLNELDNATEDNPYCNFDTFRQGQEINSNGSTTNEATIPPPLPDKPTNNTGLFLTTNTLSHEGQGNWNGSTTNGATIPPPLPYKPTNNTGLFPTNIDENDISNVVNLSNAPVIPKPPPFDLNNINRVRSPKVQNATQNLPKQSDRPNPCANIGFLSSSLINRMRGQLKPLSPAMDTQSPIYAEDAVDGIASKLSERSAMGQTESLENSSSFSVRPNVRQIIQPTPQRHKSPPATKPKPRPQSEVLRSISDSSSVQGQALNMSTHPSKPLPLPPGANRMQKRTPPPPPPKTKPKPATNRFSTYN